MRKTTRVYRRPFPWDLWLAYGVGVPVAAVLLWIALVVLFSL